MKNSDEREKERAFSKIQSKNFYCELTYIPASRRNSTASHAILPQSIDVDGISISGCFSYIAVCLYKKNPRRV